MKELEVGLRIKTTPALSVILHQNASALTSLSLADPPRIRQTHDETQSQPPTLLSHLKSLKLQFSVTTLKNISHDISCPQLEELTIHGGEADQFNHGISVPVHWIRDFVPPAPFAAWGSSLRTLHILTALHQSRILSLLQEVPTVTTLTVSDRSWNQHSTMGTLLVAFLIEQPTLVPNLSRLRAFEQTLKNPQTGDGTREGSAFSAFEEYH